MALTDIAIKNAKPRDKLYKIADSGGLCLVIHPAGGKWWRYRYRFDGKEKTLALGTYPDVSLADARERHSQARKTLAAGNDPMQVKQQTKRLRMLKSSRPLSYIYDNNIRSNRNPSQAGSNGKASDLVY